MEGLTYGTSTGINGASTLLQHFSSREVQRDTYSAMQSSPAPSSRSLCLGSSFSASSASRGRRERQSSPTFSSFRLLSSSANWQKVLSDVAGGTAGLATVSTVPALGGGVGGGGSGEGGGGFGGGGGDGGNWWSSVFDNGLAFAADESDSFDPHGLRVDTRVHVSKLNPNKKYKVTGVELIDQRTKHVVDVKDPFFELVTLRFGGITTKAQLESEVENLLKSGMFQTVEMEGLTQADGSLKMQISFVESQWQGADSFRCVNVGLLSNSRSPGGETTTDHQREEKTKVQEEDYKSRLKSARPCLLPKSVEREISVWLRTETKVTARMLQRIRDRIQRWYHDEGYACAQVVNYGNLNTNELVGEVVEGDITKVQIQFLDKMGVPCDGVTKLQIVGRELPELLKPGHVFNVEAGKKALRNVNGLALFSKIEVNPRPDEESDGGIAVEVKLNELEQSSADVSTEWSVVPGSSGRPTLASIRPGGSVTVERRNLYGLNRSIQGSVTSSNLLNPQDDLGFQAEYVHPYVDGVDDQRNRTFRASCFNTRKLSAVFTGRADEDEVPAVWVDRAGVKANLTKNFTRQSKFTYGLVVEGVTTRDDTSAICTNGSRTLPTAALATEGPPTTHSDTGVDRFAFLQGNVTHDSSRFVNGTPIGTRNIFQWDQGLGLGSKFPFFSRHQLSITQFVQLQPEDPKDQIKPPPVLVLHGRYGGCVGDLATYDAYTLGGPYSVRGYSIGELAACRRFLELATEFRVPVKSTHAYAFVEYGTDLGSSKDVRGNATEYFRRAGNGASYGIGLKLGSIRAEYAKDCDADSGSLFVKFGERF